MKILFIIISLILGVEAVLSIDKVINRKKRGILMWLCLVITTLSYSYFALAVLG